MSEKKFVPDYETECENCGQSPTVTLEENGKVTSRWDMCGPCTFGTARALNVDEWNGEGDW